jgi:hypothetical protein
MMSGKPSFSLEILRTTMKFSAAPDDLAALAVTTRRATAEGRLS